MTKNLCFICNKLVSGNIEHKICKTCQVLAHTECISTLNLSTQIDSWECNRCSLPSSHVISSEVKSLISSLNLIPTSIDPIEEDGEDDENFLANSVDCKYYELHEFQEIPNKSKCFSAIHLNISSLDKHFDKLHTLLASCNHQFEIIGITETRLFESIQNTGKYSIQNYKVVDMPTEASAGGALIYIADHLSFIPREDLSNSMYKAKSLESVFIEICEPKKKSNSGVYL